MAVGSTVNLVRPHEARSARFVIASTSVLLLLIVAAVAIWVPVTRSRNIAFYVDGQPVTEAHLTAMMTDLPFDSTSDYYQAHVELLNPTDPKAQYLTAGLKTEAIQRLVIMHAQAAEAAKAGVTVNPSDLDAAVQAYIKDHTTQDDAAEVQRLQTPEMRSYIELRAVSQAYEASLTKGTTMSPSEIRQYYATWAWHYTDAKGHQLTFDQANTSTKFIEDAVATKKLQLITDNRAQLLKHASSSVTGDTRYKQFMRWWDIMFSIQVPDALQPLRVDTGS
jgi:hypothetical protein